MLALVASSGGDAVAESHRETRIKTAIATTMRCSRCRRFSDLE